MLNYYVGALKNYAVFNGRARRAEFWQYALVNFVIAIVLYVIGLAMGSLVLYYIYGVAVLVPGLAIMARRLHDTNRSGWWILIALVPLVGAIVLLVFACLEGDRGPNQHGPDPKVPAEAYPGGVNPV